MVLVVCDGHGGSACSTYAHKALARALETRCGEAVASADATTGPSGALLTTALGHAVIDVEKAWCSQGRRRRDPSGCCLAALLISGTDLVCCWWVLSLNACSQNVSPDRR